MKIRDSIRKALFFLLIVNYVGVFLVFSTYHGHHIRITQSASLAEFSTAAKDPLDSDPPSCMICVVLCSTLPFLFQAEYNQADIHISPFRTEEQEFTSLTFVYHTQSRSPPAPRSV